MRLRVTDHDSQRYVFDAGQSEFVKRILNNNVQLECRQLELEMELELEKFLRQKAERKCDEVVMASIADLG